MTSPVRTGRSGPAAGEQNAVTLVVSVPWITTAPAAPAAIRSPMRAASS
jgi:hypothetical protein